MPSKNEHSGTSAPLYDKLTELIWKVQTELCLTPLKLCVNSDDVALRRRLWKKKHSCIRRAKQIVNGSNHCWLLAHFLLVPQVVRSLPGIGIVDNGDQINTDTKHVAQRVHSGAAQSTCSNDLDSKKSGELLAFCVRKKETDRKNQKLGLAKQLTRDLRFYDRSRAKCI